MADLHIFGDSYSVDWEQLKLKPWTGQAKYYEWLGKTPEHFQNLIKNEFKINKIHNHAVGGFCNYSIMESIGNHINKIKSDDYVCIGWSDISRYRIVYTDNNNDVWVRLLAGNHTVPSKYKEDVSKQFMYQSVDRDCDLTLVEVTAWQNILKKALPTNTIYWSPFGIKSNSYPTPSFDFSKISDECDIDDAHMGSNGMLEVGEWLVKLFKDNPFNNRKSNYYIGNRLI